MAAVGLAATGAPSTASPAPGGSVLLDLADTPRPPHERGAHETVARQLAALQGMTYAGIRSPGQRPAGRLYFVPQDVLVASTASSLGIDGEQDLFGGVVAHPIMASKAITHPLVDPDALRPAFWSDEFAHRVMDVTLAGRAVFTRADARRAGRRLLAEGPVRIKPTDATAGRGQVVADSAAALDAMLERFDETRMAHCGLVLEANLSEVTTYSVGYVRVGEREIAYYGSQRLTRDNGGEEVYGGSDLVAHRGDLGDLLRQRLPDVIRIAVSQALAYDAAARDCFPAMFASRRNYDVAMGVDAQGQRCSGVLEPSWRIGGASGAELAALLHFQTHPDACWVRASTVEHYGPVPALPQNATLLFSGDDPEVGPLTKYAMVTADGDP